MARKDNKKQMNGEEKVDKKTKEEIKQILRNLPDGEILEISFGIEAPEDDYEEDRKNER